MLQVKELMMILPWWPSKAWFSTLQRMLVTVRRLRVCRDLVVDLQTGTIP